MFVMWVAASTTAVGVAWAGVSVVDDQVVDQPSALAADGSGVPGQAPVSTSTESNLPIGTDQAGANAGQGDDGMPESMSSTILQSPGAQSPGAQSPGTLATTPRPPVSQAPVTQAPTTQAATTQTFSLTGGTAAISFSSSGVQVLWATPNPGFDVSIEPESPGVKVEFRADHHRSRLDAWWSGGPQNRIREEPRD